MSNDKLSSRKLQGLHFLFPVLMLLGWFLWLERGRGKLKRNQKGASGNALSKNMPVQKGKQSLEGVRSPRGEEGKTARCKMHEEASGTTERPITHPLPVSLARQADKMTTHRQRSRGSV